MKGQNFAFEAVKQKCQTKRKIKFFKISVPKLFDWIENK
jgi:hypothetical protein